MSYLISTTNIKCPACKTGVTLEHYEEMGSGPGVTGVPLQHYVCPLCDRMYDTSMERLQPWLFYGDER